MSRDGVTELRVSARPPDPASLEGLLAEVELRLRAAARGEPLAAAVPGMLEVPAFARLVQRCQLSPFEAQVVLLGAAMQLHAEVPQLCAEVAGDDAATQPSFGVALQAFAEGHWDAFLPGSPLRRLGLVELEDGPVLTARPLRLAERVLHALLGHHELDPRIARRVHRLQRPTECPQRHARVLRALIDAPRVHLQAPRVGEGAAWAAELAAHGERDAWQLSPHEVPVDAAERDVLLCLWNREVRLGSVALVVDLDERVEASQMRATLDFLHRAEGQVIASSVDPMPGARASWQRGALPTLDFEERRVLWQGGLETAEPEMLDSLAARFELDAGQIASVASAARSSGDAWHPPGARPRRRGSAARFPIRSG